jgi:hypothetical protein
MIIQIDRGVKIALLNALKSRYLDTEKLPELEEAIRRGIWPAGRLLTREEAQELIRSLEEEY